MPSQEEILRALATKKVNSQCPFCGDNNWYSNGTVTATMPVDANGSFVVGGGSIFPSVQIQCMSCGYIASFNAKVLGLQWE